MIRHAAPADIPELVELARDFHAYSPWADLIPYDPEGMADFIGRLIEHGVVLMSEDGMCAGLLNPAFFNPSFVMAAELMWWAPKDGRALRLAFEEWALANGAHAVQFSGLGDDRAPTIAKLFKRAGYTPVETGFFKRLVP